MQLTDTLGLELCNVHARVPEGALI
jgi:hypothetical protein